VLAERTPSPMAPTGAAADWSELGKLFYRKRELYQMLWREQMGVGRLDDDLVACARYGGPIAVVRDDRKLTRVGAGAHQQVKPWRPTQTRQPPTAEPLGDESAGFQNGRGHSEVTPHSYNASSAAGFVGRCRRTAVSLLASLG
jgi:hypothetical protein